MDTFTKWGPAIGRGSLYFLIAFLTPFSEQMLELLKTDAWPSAQRVAGAALAGLLMGMLALRAFVDGTVNRISTGEK